MKHFTALLFLLAPAAFAQPSLGPPSFGMLADANGSLRPVNGFAGNVWFGDSLAENVRSAAWSGKAGMVKTDSSLLVLDAQGQQRFTLDTGEGTALFAFTADGQPALALLPLTGALYGWQVDHLEAAVFDASTAGGTVLSIAAWSGGAASLIVQRDDGVWRVDLAGDGSMAAQAALPGVNAPVMLQPDGSLVYVDGTQTVAVVRAADGTERRVELGFPVAELRRLSADWVEARDGGSPRHFAVRVTAGALVTTQLPEAGQ